MFTKKHFQRLADFTGFSMAICCDSVRDEIESFAIDLAREVGENPRFNENKFKEAINAAYVREIEGIEKDYGV